MAIPGRRRTRSSQPQRTMRSRRPATRRSSDGDQDNEDSFNLDTHENPDDERRGSPAPVGITAGYSLADGSGGSTTATGASTTATRLGADDNGPPTEPPTQPGPATPSSDAQNAEISLINRLAEAMVYTLRRQPATGGQPSGATGLPQGSPTSYPTGSEPPLVQPKRLLAGLQSPCCKSRR